MCTYEDWEWFYDTDSDGKVNRVALGKMGEVVELCLDTVLSELTALQKAWEQHYRETCPFLCLFSDEGKNEMTDYSQLPVCLRDPEGIYLSMFSEDLKESKAKFAVLRRYDFQKMNDDFLSTYGRAFSPLKGDKQRDVWIRIDTDGSVTDISRVEKLGYECFEARYHGFEGEVKKAYLVTHLFPMLISSQSVTNVDTVYVFLHLRRKVSFARNVFYTAHVLLEQAPFHKSHLVENSDSRRHRVSSGKTLADAWEVESANIVRHSVEKMKAGIKSNRDRFSKSKRRSMARIVGTMTTECGASALQAFVQFMCEGHPDFIQISCMPESAMGKEKVMVTIVLAHLMFEQIVFSSTLIEQDALDKAAAERKKRAERIAYVHHMETQLKEAQHRLRVKQVNWPFRKRTAPS